MLGRIKNITVQFRHINRIAPKIRHDLFAKKLGLRKNTVGVSICCIDAVIKKNDESFVLTLSGFAFRAKGDNFDKNKGKALSFKRAYQECPRLVQKAVREKYPISKWKLKEEEEEGIVK